MGKKGFSPVYVLLILILVAVIGFGGYYVWNENKDVSNTEAVDDITETTEETANVEEPQSIRYTSTLYPDLSFDVPEGWEVDEPNSYDITKSAGSANSVITVSNGDSELLMSFLTVPPTGFETYNCTYEKNLTQVGKTYRYEDESGNVLYKSGSTVIDPNWDDILTGDYAQIQDKDPNFCVIFPFIGTYNSTVRQQDHPDTPYGFTSNEYAMVWMSAELKGTISPDNLKASDSIIRSLSPSARPD